MRRIVLSLLCLMTLSAAAGAQPRVATGEEPPAPAGSVRFALPPASVRAAAQATGAAKSVSTDQSSLWVLASPVEGERFVLAGGVRTPEAVTEAVTIRVAGHKTARVQIGWSSVGETLASGNFSGLVSDPESPLALFGRQQASVAGRYPDGRPLLARTTVLTPHMDQVAACRLDAGGDRIWVGYRLRGYRPDTPAPQGEYRFRLDGFEGRARYEFIQGVGLPAPLWIGLEVDGFTYDGAFAGTHAWQLEIEGHGWTPPDSWYVIMWERSALGSCKG